MRYSGFDVNRQLRPGEAALRGPFSLVRNRAWLSFRTLLEMAACIRGSRQRVDLDSESTEKLFSQDCLIPNAKRDIAPGCDDEEVGTSRDGIAGLEDLGPIDRLIGEDQMVIRQEAGHCGSWPKDIR